MTTFEFYSRYLRVRDDLIEAKAKQLDKSRCDLIPWNDYDPIMIENKAREIAQGGGLMWTGD